MVAALQAAAWVNSGIPDTQIKPVAPIISGYDQMRISIKDCAPYCKTTHNQSAL